jgi:hypothetical protein
LSPSEEGRGSRPGAVPAAAWRPQLARWVEKAGSKKSAARRNVALERTAVRSPAKAGTWHCLAAAARRLEEVEAAARRTSASAPVAVAAVGPVAVETAPSEEARRQPVKEEGVLPPAAVSKEKVAAENQKKRAVAEQVMMMMMEVGSKKSQEPAAKRMMASMAMGGRPRHRRAEGAAWRSVLLILWYCKDLEWRREAITT